jgi:NAD+ synthase (glutamine-hydrolysing)
MSDFLRIATLSPELRVADVGFNTQTILASLHAAAKRGAAIALFPELCLTGYSCGDLFAQTLLQERARAALMELAAATRPAGPRTQAISTDHRGIL